MRITIGLLGTVVLDVELTQSNVIRLDELTTDDADEAEPDFQEPPERYEFGFGHGA